MQLYKLVILLPLLTAITSRVLNENRIRIINLLLSLAVPALIGYYRNLGVAFDVHVWTYMGGYFILSALLFRDKSDLRGKLELFQVLYSMSLIVVLAGVPYFAVMGVVGSSFILLLLFMKFKIEFKCRNRIIGLAAFNLISDSFLVLFLILNSVEYHSVIGNHMLIAGVFIKLLQLPYLFCMKSDEGKGYLVNILYYPLSILMLCSYLFVNFHIDVYTASTKAIFSSVVLIVLIAYCVYSILINDLRESFFSLGAILAVKSFITHFVLGSQSINPALEGTYMISVVFALYLIWGEILQTFGNSKIFGIYGAKEKLTLVFISMLVFIYLAFGLWGSIPYYQNMNYISYFLDTSIPYFSVISMTLYSTLIFTTIAAVTKIFAVIFLRKTEVPWCPMFEGGRIFGSRWQYAMSLLASFGYIVFINIKLSAEIKTNYSVLLIVLMMLITIIPLVLFFYLSVLERNRYENLSSSIFQGNDIGHKAMCLDRFINVFSLFNERINKYAVRFAECRFEISNKRVDLLISALSKSNFGSDAVVLVILLVFIGTLVCYIA